MLDMFCAACYTVHVEKDGVIVVSLLLLTKTRKGHYFDWTKPKMWLDSIKEAFTCKVHFGQKS